MTRSEARLLTSIWSDADFLALTGGQQRLFMALLSQPDLTHAGTLTLAERRWARQCADGSVDAVTRDLKVLEAARFVVVDEDTEELLVRALVRRDRVWRQPNVFLGAVASMKAIVSPRLRAALRAELERLDVSELSDQPGRYGRAAPRELVGQALAEVLAHLGGNPSPNPSPNPSGDPSTEHPGTLPEAFPEPFPEGIPEGPGVGVGAGVGVGVGAGEVVDLSGEVSAAAARELTREAQQQPEHLASEHLAALGLDASADRRLTDAWVDATRAQLAAGRSAAHVRAALARQRERGISARGGPGLLAEFVAEVAPPASATSGPPRFTPGLRPVGALPADQLAARVRTLRGQLPRRTA